VENIVHIGDMVHYRPVDATACHAALVVAIDPFSPTLHPIVNVVAFAPTGEQVAALAVAYGSHEGWHWGGSCV
jgi:hypothetical protein